MSQFDAEKLAVSFLPPANAYMPVEGRKYTLTHSDTTGMLFLSIGYVYDTVAIHPYMRDEVIAQWTAKDTQLVLFGKAYVSGGEFDVKAASKRFAIFQREMGTALRAFVYGDQQLYAYFPNLLKAPIYIYFESVYPEFSRVVYYGTIQQYLQAAKEEKQQ